MRTPRRLLFALVALVVAGCGAAPEPASAPPPPASSSPAAPVTTRVDSVGSVPGSPDAAFVYRFRQTLPGSDRFAFRDRELSFYFRPSPNALYFKVENLQGRPVSIDWDRSVFYDPVGRTDKVGHATSRFRDRFSPQAMTVIPGQQEYSDFVFPMDYLLDPGGGDEQLRKPLLPEDSTAPTYASRVFGVDLVFMVEDRPRTYEFRFEVVSVNPR